MMENTRWEASRLGNDYPLPWANNPWQRHDYTVPLGKVLTTLYDYLIYYTLSHGIGSDNE